MPILQMLPPPSALVLAFVSLNAATFAAFGLDKVNAVAGRRRTGEATLLQLAFFGGTPGAYAGRAVFRHKTRKRPFSSKLHAVAVLQSAVLAAAAGWWVLG